MPPAAAAETGWATPYDNRGPRSAYSPARRLLAELSGVPVTPANDLVEATQDAGALVQLSSVFKRIAVKTSKICNDLRLLSSGPQNGFNDISLPAVQAGSSIMPGKVNPVIPEVVNQIAFETIRHAPYDARSATWDRAGPADR